MFADQYTAARKTDATPMPESGRRELAFNRHLGDV